MDITEIQQINDNQVIVVNIKYNTTGNYFGKKVKIEDLPVTQILTLPDNVFSLKEKSEYFDVVESFVYNILSKKYGYEVCFAQIYLP